VRPGRGRAAAEDLDDRDNEGEGLPRTSGGIDGDVLVRQEQRDGCLLHRRAPVEAAAVQGLQHLRGLHGRQLQEPLLRQRAVPAGGRQSRRGEGHGWSRCG
jgi:hypothetical protein